MYLTIYLIGFVVNWFWMRYIRHYSNEYTWGIVFLSLLISCFSWAGTIMIIIGESNDGKIKPPKWL